MRSNFEVTKKMARALVGAMLLLTVLSGCAKYGGRWRCSNVRGIGCSSIEEAERVAKDQILLNTGKSDKKKIEIKEHYEGFKKVPAKTIEAD